ncbi:MAG: hypothetical protein R8J41_05895 [Alphaproteobacteria bacterium]|nr:hypothetical protein [Alphaproteobacteria bacterium]
MAIIRIPSDQADIASALAVANPGDTIEFESGLNQTDFTVTVNNLTLNAAGGEDFTVTLATPGVTQVTTTGAGSVEIIGNDDGNTITDSSTGSFFQDITLGDGTDTLIAGRGDDVIRVGEGTKAIDLGAFTDVGQTNSDGGSLNLSDTDFIVAETRGTSEISIFNFSLQEDQNAGETDDRLIFGGTTRADFAANAKFFVGQTITGGPFPGALTSLGGYTDTSDWNLSIAFDYDGNGQNDAIFMLHDLFDADQQTQMKTLLTNTDFTPADIGNEVEIAAADEAGFINGTLNPLGNDNIAFALLVDPTRDALNDGQLDVATGLIAYRTITSALAAAGEGDVLVLAPGDHTFASTVNSVTVSVSNITFEPLGAGPGSIPAITLASGVQDFQSRLEAGGLEITGSDTSTAVSSFETNDFFVGGAGDDAFTNFDGIDTFNGMAGDDTAGYLLTSNGTLTFDGGEGGETEGDTIALFDETGLNQSVFLNGSTQDGLVADVGLLPNRVTATNVEKLSVSTGGGNDVFTLTGNLSDVGILQANVSTFSLTATIFTTGGNNSFDASGLTSTTGIAFVGAAGNDTYIGSIGGDLLFDQGGGINSFTGGGGDDVLFVTGGGTNTAHYALSSENYVITTVNSGTQVQVRAVNGTEGTDTLTGITHLSFNGGAETGAVTQFVSSGRSDFGLGAADEIVFDVGGFLVVKSGEGFSFGFMNNDRTARLLGDFDGDGDADFVAELDGSGAHVVVDPTSGNTFIGQADRTAKAVGDFDGDGDDDILFTLDAGGHHVIGNVGAANVFLGRSDRSVQATGDFDGDGDDDILMKLTAGGAHVVEKINEANVFIGGADRTARAVGDFDGDGDDDILMEINATGAYVIEKLGEANVFVGRSDRTVVGVGDFDGDGDDDILFTLDAGGHHVIEKIGEANVFVGRSDRTAQAIGDFDGDGDDDIMMKLTVDGAHVIEKIGEANQFYGEINQTVFDLGMTDLGLAFEVV